MHVNAILTDAVPAVTVPFFLKTGGSLARPSMVASLGCSSTEKSSSPNYNISGH